MRRMLVFARNIFSSWRQTFRLSWTRWTWDNARAKHAVGLNLGCGTRPMPNWVNTDYSAGKGVFVIDLSRKLPMANKSFDYIYSEHFLEHLERSDAAHLIRECKRVLKDSGVIRVSTPDLDSLVRAYTSGNLSVWTKVGWTPTSTCALLNEGMHSWGHKYIFNFSEIVELFEAEGFRNIRRVMHGCSSHLALSGLETRPSCEDLIIEADLLILSQNA